MTTDVTALPPSESASQPTPMVEARAAEQYIVDRHGVAPPEHPSLVEPLRLTELDDTQLMDRFEEANAWWEYLDWNVELLSIEAKRCSQHADQVLAEAAVELLNNGVKSRAEAERRAEMQTNVRAAKARAHAAAERERMGRQALAIYDRRAEKLSRELTRRVHRAPIDGRRRLTST